MSLVIDAGDLHALIGLHIWARIPWSAFLLVGLWLYLPGVFVSSLFCFLHWLLIFLLSLLPADIVSQTGSEGNSRIEHM